MVFKILNVRQWSTVIPEKQEISEVSPMVYLAYWLKRIPDCGAGRRNWGRTPLWDAPKLIFKGKCIALPLIEKVLKSMTSASNLRN